MEHSNFLVGEPTINGPCSKAMLNYDRGKSNIEPTFLGFVQTWGYPPNKNSMRPSWQTIGV